MELYIPENIILLIALIAGLLTIVSFLRRGRI